MGRRCLSLIAAMAFWSPASQALVVAAVGDIMMGTDYPTNALPADRGASLFRAATPFLARADVRFGNLEGTLYDGPRPADGKAAGHNRYIFRTPTAMAARLVEAGFNVLSLANNHVHDFGGAGLVSTKATLRRSGIPFSSKDGEVAEPARSVALIATDFYSGPRSLTTPESTLSEIAQLKRRSGIVIVSCHAGAEGPGATHARDRTEVFLGENRGNSVAFAHRAIDAGADLILMSGPHVPRGMELYRGRLIVYSLGNFATGRGISVAGLAGMAPLVLAKLADDGRFENGYIASFVQDRARGVILDREQRALRVISSLSREDFPETGPAFARDGSFRPPESLRPTPMP